MIDLTKIFICASVFEDMTFKDQSHSFCPGIMDAKTGRHIESSEGCASFVRQATGDEIKLKIGDLKRVLELIASLESLPNRQAAIQAYPKQLQDIFPDIVGDQIILSEEEFKIQKAQFLAARASVAQMNRDIASW